MAQEKSIENIAKAFRDRIAAEADKKNRPIEYMPITYDSVAKMILEGRNINEMYSPEDEQEKNKVLKIMKELEIVAAHSRKAVDGSLKPNEEMVELIKIAQRGTSLTEKKVKANLNMGECSNGKINNIINNVFNGNRYTAYYILSRMKREIIFDKNYDSKIYEKMQEETTNKLGRLTSQLNKLEMMREFKLAETMQENYK